MQAVKKMWFVCNYRRLRICSDMFLHTHQIFKNDRISISPWQSRSMSHTSHWGYGAENGPSKWSEMFPTISAYNKQSPIDLTVANLLEAKPPLTLKYDCDCCQTLSNTGHTLQVSGIPQDSYVTGGPLCCDKYRFAQFHLHWGPNDNCGSEHTVDGRPFSAEIHIVNWNSTKFCDATAAMADQNHEGICVLGVLVEADSSYELCEFDELTLNSERVCLPNSQGLLRNPIDIMKLIPEDHNDYFYYEGSLTTPPCTECVKWIVFGQPIHVSSESLARLRQLQAGDGSGSMITNYRDPQPLNDRSLWRQMKCHCDSSSSSSSSDSSSESS